MVRDFSRTLLPVVRIERAREHEHPVADRGHGPAELPEVRDAGLQHVAPQVLAHAGRVPSGQEQRVVGAHVELAPLPRLRELHGGLELAVVRAGLRRGAELAEDHAGQQSRIRLRAHRPALRGEDDRVPGAGEQPPGHGHLGDVEVAIGQGHQDASQAPVP